MRPEAIPAALNAHIAKMVSGFDGEPYPAYVFLHDSDGKFALFRMQQADAELEMLAHSGLFGWPLAVTVIAASGSGKSMTVKLAPEPRRQ
jgi:hypothetical protein